MFTVYGTCNITSYVDIIIIIVVLNMSFDLMTSTNLE